MRFMVLWSVRRAPIKRVSDLNLLRLFDDLPQKLVVNRLLHKNPSGRDAVLSLVKEDAAHRDPDRFVEVEIRENNEWTFAAQLERNLFQV